MLVANWECANELTNKIFKRKCAIKMETNTFIMQYFFKDQKHLYFV